MSGGPAGEHARLTRLGYRVERALLDTPGDPTLNAVRVWLASTGFGVAFSPMLGLGLRRVGFDKEPAFRAALAALYCAPKDGPRAAASLAEACVERVEEAPSTTGRAEGG